MYLLIEDNPNSTPEERVFAAHGELKTAKRVQATPPNGHEAIWCDITGVDENGVFVPAKVIRVDDSADGTAWLVHGGAWGLRLKPKTSTENWSIDSNNQWGLPFLVLDSSGSAIELA